MAPGSIPTNATEIYQEGLRIPPLKYAKPAVVNETLVADASLEHAHCPTPSWAT